MTPQEFRAALASLGYETQRRFAARVGVDERTVQRWASGETRIPARVALVLELEAERAASGRPSEAARAPDRA
jgi:DNA-binding transcriptional regulator YdaS (Cro superfamily)